MAGMAGAEVTPRAPGSSPLFRRSGNISTMMSPSSTTSLASPSSTSSLVSPSSIPLASHSSTPLASHFSTPLATPPRLASPATQRLSPTAAPFQPHQGRRLHIANIPFSWREVELARLFGLAGVVTDAEVVTNERGSKGFGFVSMSSSGEAAQARQALHGAVVEGRRVEVNPAHPKAPRRPPSRCEEAAALVEARTRLAEAQLAMLELHHRILCPQVHRLSGLY